MMCLKIIASSKNCVVKRLNETIVGSFIRKRRKCSSLDTIYAGLIVFFVPSVLCNSDIWGQLTYEDIYNRTSYPQVQYTPRPYDLPLEHSFNNHIINRHSKESRNHIEVLDQDGVGSSQLLVGFARDPFRYSVPAEDYMKGVRYVSPKPYSYSSRGENRGKRGVLHLYNMIYCATGCEPLTYKGYGCYCGFLGSGRPMDGIDRCCKIHDDCYENIYCPFFTVYFQPYYWKCYKGQPLCALENYHTQHQFINGCAAKLCECDRKIAMCLKKYACPRRRALCTSSPLRLLQNLLSFR